MENINMEWPYPVQYDKETHVAVDVLILGGGLAGCYAAIAAARKGLKVAIVDKSAVIHSGAGGVGIDHFSCPLNPGSKVSIGQYIASRGKYNNFILKYILAQDGYEILCEMEKMGVKVRDTDDEFEGADFRDEKTKLLYAFDHENKHTIRFWGVGMKPSLYRECKRLGVEMYERIMVTSLLNEGGKQGNRIIGATGFDTRTGKFYVFQSKASVLCMSTPDRLWFFSSEWTGLIGRDGPPTNIGDGHAMAFRAGAELAKMEASSHEEWGGSTGVGSILFGSGGNYATWYPCSIVDANGKVVPWINTKGESIGTEVWGRTHPSKEEGFFTLVLGKGEGAPGAFPVLTRDLKERIQKGEFKLPLYADLTHMSAKERRAIFGLMVGQEGTTYPVYRNLTKAGFNPDQDMLQVYELGPTPIGWRRLRYGGLMHDWDLKTSLEGLYAAGQQLYDGCGCSQALATGRWAGSMAAEYAAVAGDPVIDNGQVEKEKQRIFAPLERDDGINWKELETGIGKVLQDYCGDVKTEELLKLGLIYLQEIKEAEAATLFARNPHELMRALEAFDILTCAEIVMHASMARKASSDELGFERLDYPEDEPKDWSKWITIKLRDNKLVKTDVALDYFAPIAENYGMRKDKVVRDADCSNWRKDSN